MAVKRMDNVGIVVEDLAATIEPMSTIMIGSIMLVTVLIASRRTLA